MRIASGRAKERSLSASKRCRTGESRESRTHRVGDDGNRCDQKMKCEQCVTALPGRNARSKRWLTPELKRTILDGQCLKRFIEPEEVAILVAFLASDDAKSCKNQTFIIDAGWD